MLRVSANCWYKLEHHTTRTDGYTTVESYFCRFFKNHTLEEKYHDDHFAEKSAKIKNPQISNSSKIFLNDVKDFIFAAEHRDITGDCSAL